MLYPFVKNPGVINSISFGFLDLAKPNVALAILAGAAQYWQTKMMLVNAPPKDLQNKEGAKDETMTAIMSKQMTFMMPLFTVIIGLTLPGGLTLYFLVFSLLMGFQQMHVLKNKKSE